MNTLLIVINQPEKSKDFVKYTFNMAKDLQANIQVLFVQNSDYQPFVATGVTGTAKIQVEETIEENTEDAISEMKQYINELNSKTPNNLKIDISDEFPSIKWGIEKYITENKANMVVMKGQENDLHSIQDLINNDVAQFIDCPVWIIPPEANYHEYKEIVYATDYKEEDITTLNRLIKLMGHLSPKITALHITENLDFEERIRKAGFLETVQKKTSYSNINIKSVVNQKEDDIAQLINDFAVDHKVDLVAVLKENRHFLERIFKPNPTKKIIKQAELPLLIYHEKD